MKFFCKNIPVFFCVMQSSGLWSLLFLWLHFQYSPLAHSTEARMVSFLSSHTARILSLQVTSCWFTTWKALSSATHILPSLSFCSKLLYSLICLCSSYSLFFFQTPNHYLMYFISVSFSLSCILNSATLSYLNTCFCHRAFTHNICSTWNMFFNIFSCHFN